MRVPSHPTQVRRMLESRLKQLVPTGPVLAASLIGLNKRCGQSSCRCHHGGPLHQAYHLTFRQGGKTRTAYVPKDLVAEVRTGIQEYRRLKALIQEVSQLALVLIQGHVRHRRRRRGRREPSVRSWRGPCATSSPRSTPGSTGSTIPGSPRS